MEIITHLINDTIEFYKWTLTIAGNAFKTSGMPESICVRYFKIREVVFISE